MLMNSFDNLYVKSICEDAISLFNLELDDLTVLTEAANGHFFITPIIAAMAGANVIAVTKDSIYGKKEEVQSFVKKKARQFKVDNKILFVFDPKSRNNPLTKDHISSSDIITNSGFLRPLDKLFLQAIKPQTVIAGMCENWEIRSVDINLQECRGKNIHVVAVNEQSELLDIFRYVGYLAMKMIFECSLAVYLNKFLIVSTDKFGDTIADILNLNGAKTKIVPTLSAPIPRVNAIIIADCTSNETIAGKENYLTINKIKSMNPKPLLIHIAGKVNFPFLEKNGIQCFPKKHGRAKTMSETLAYLGIKPVIELHTAGLQAANIVFKDIASGFSCDDIKKKYENHHLCQIL